MLPPAKEALGKETVYRLIEGGKSLLKPIDVLSSPSIATIVSIGDVNHVFSHIKKTYTVQWVLLEGGERPPPLAPIPSPKKRQGPGNRGVKSMSAKKGGAAGLGEVCWVSLDSVEDTKHVLLSFSFLMSSNDHAAWELGL